MKILLVSDGIPPFVIGGMQKHSTEFTRYLSQTGNQVTLVHCTYDNNKVPDESKVYDVISGNKENIKIVGFKFPTSRSLPGHYIRNMKKYSKMVFDYFKNDISSYDLIYCQGFAGYYFTEKKLSEKSFPKICLNFHGLNMFQESPNFKTKIQNQLLFRGTAKKMLQNADIIHSFGGKILDITKSFSNPSAIIHEFKIGLGECWFTDYHNKTEDSRHFVFVGRYDLVKGIKELTEVVEDLIQDKFDFKFTFIGPIPKNHQISGSKIKYAGLIVNPEEIQEIYAKADVIVCPSHSEGFPIVLLEAMANYTAVIASNVGAINTVINENNGDLIRPANSNELRKAMIRFIEMSNDDLNQLKLNARKSAENYKWEKIISEWNLFAKSAVN